MKRILNSLGRSFVLAAILFSVIRLSHDLTIGENYWHIHTRTFIMAELLMTWGYSFIAVLLTPVLISFGYRCLCAATEYLIVALFATACALSAMSVSHNIDPDNMTFTQIILPLTVTVLFTCLYYSYCRSNERDRRLTRQAITLEKTRSEQLAVELRLLRTQYHPHFLFNMLNTIYVQIDEDNEAARSTVESLSEVLRYQLYSPEKPVRITSEIDVLKKFISLCSLRTSRSLHLDTDIVLPYESAGLFIYPLLLIPLVENAFKHVGGDYRISILFGLTDASMLRLHVVNSLPQTDGPHRTEAAGLGLDNLRRRLALLYPGPSHSLVLEKESDSFHATLTLKPIYSSLPT